MSKADEKDTPQTSTGEQIAGGDPGASEPAAVASREANANLEHTDGGSTTRADLTDAGVPMLPGDAGEPVGPEDALGVGDKRGDYRKRIVGDPHESRALEGGGQNVTRWVDQATGAAAKEGAEGAVEVIVDRTPVSALVPQAPRAEQIGDVGGLKGGVETDPDAALSAGAMRRAVAADRGEVEA